MQNTADGREALFDNTTGSGNTANGDGPLGSNMTGNFNTALGFNAGINITKADEVIAIGHSGADVSNSCFIGNIFGVTVSSGTTAVFINSFGQLGTINSSRRFKNEIKPMALKRLIILILTLGRNFLKTAWKRLPYE